MKSKTNENIAIYCPNGVSYVIAEWACWMSGNVAVPLAKEQSAEEIDFVMKDAKCSLILTTDLAMDTVRTIEIHTLNRSNESCQFSRSKT